MVTLAPLTSSTPPVLPPGTTRKLPLANSTVSPLPSALYTPAFRYWFDRKSTRLNSSHSQISHADFCLTTMPAFNSPACHTTSPCANRFSVAPNSFTKTTYWAPPSLGSTTKLLGSWMRSEEHTSELQSQADFVRRLMHDRTQSTNA